MYSFRIRGLPAERFQNLFRLSDSELEQHLARRVVAEDAGYPCRISLTDATPGDTVILLNYEHHGVATPFRASHAIYVREGERTFDAVDEVPRQLRQRMLSLRGFDRHGMLRKAELVDGMNAESGITALFEEPSIDYIHAHFAKYGCYAALIERH
jgi:hypothetical protein